MVVSIDYFRRKVFARSIISKEALKILEYIRDVNNEISINRLICNNGRKFDNEALKAY